MSATVPGADDGVLRGAEQAGQQFLLTAATAFKQDDRSGDPLVTTAFALGWHMAELYRPTVRSRSGAQDDLPGFGELTATDQSGFDCALVTVGLTKLTPAITDAGLTVPAVDDVTTALTPGTRRSARSLAIRALHVNLLTTLTAADFRLGKAYGLGRALADTCMKPSDQASLQYELGHYRIETLRAWLEDLESALPAHAGESVSDSLAEWSKWAASPAAGGQADAGAQPGAGAEADAGAQADAGAPSALWTQATAGTPVGASGQAGADGQPVADAQPAAGAQTAADLRRLRDQGRLWRSLLSGEKAATDMLSMDDYVQAGGTMLRRSRKLVWEFLTHHLVLVGAVLVLFFGGIALMLADQSGTASIVAGASGVLASFGLSWKGIGGSLGRAFGKLEQPLWEASLDDSITAAITLVPGVGTGANFRDQEPPESTHQPAARGSSRSPAGKATAASVETQPAAAAADTAPDPTATDAPTEVMPVGSTPAGAAPDDSPAPAGPDAPAAPAASDASAPPAGAPPPAPPKPRRRRTADGGR